MSKCMSEWTTALHDWNLDPAAAVAKQREMATRLTLTPPWGTSLDEWPATITGVDIGFEDEGEVTRAAVVTLDLATLEPLEQQLTRQPTRMPYIPGLLSFRELPAAIAALESLERAPECLMVDGHGIAHPRRLGVAAHLGLWCDLPSFGVAKKRLCGKHGEPGDARGDWVALTDRVREADGELGIIENTELPRREQRSQLGAVLRSRAKVKPVFVSPGQRMNLDTALAMTLHCLGKTKLPEPTRLADQLASRRLKRLRDA